jgi:hypothetical protein
MSYRHSVSRVHFESALAGVQDTMYSLVAPRELSVVTSEYVESAVFYTDGSLIGGGFGFKLSSKAGVFSAEVSALFMDLQHIREVVQPPEKYLILTDILSSIKAMLNSNSSARI